MLFSLTDALTRSMELDAFFDRLNAEDEANGGAEGHTMAKQESVRLGEPAALETA